MRSVVLGMEVVVPEAGIGDQPLGDVVARGCSFTPSETNVNVIEFVSASQAIAVEVGHQAVHVAQLGAGSGSSGDAASSPAEV